MQSVLILSVQNIGKIDSDVLHHHLFGIAANEGKRALIPQYDVSDRQSVHAVEEHSEYPGMSEADDGIVAVDFSHVVFLAETVEIVSAADQTDVAVDPLADGKVSVGEQGSVRVVFQVKAATFIRTKNRRMGTYF